MNADWHRASVQYAMQNVAAVTKSGGDSGTELVGFPDAMQRETIAR